jgi:hypothetical protein
MLCYSVLLFKQTCNPIVTELLVYREEEKKELVVMEKTMRLCEDSGTDGEDEATEGDHVASGGTSGLGGGRALGGAAAGTRGGGLVR